MNCKSALNFVAQKTVKGSKMVPLGESAIFTIFTIFALRSGIPSTDLRRFR